MHHHWFKKNVFEKVVTEVGVVRDVHECKTVLVGGLYRSRFFASHFEFESTRHGSKVMPVQAPFILQATPEEFQSPPYDGMNRTYLGEASRTHGRYVANTHITLIGHA